MNLMIYNEKTKEERPIGYKKLRLKPNERLRLKLSFEDLRGVLQSYISLLDATCAGPNGKYTEFMFGLNVNPESEDSKKTSEDNRKINGRLHKSIG